MIKKKPHLKNKKRPIFKKLANSKLRLPQGLRLGHSNNPNIVIKKNNTTYTIKNNQVKSVATVSSNPPSFNVLDRNTADMSASERAAFDNRPVFDKANEIYDNAEIPRANADGFIPGFGSVYKDGIVSGTYLDDKKPKTGLYKEPWS